MKNTLKYISIHFLAWTLLLMVPYYSAYQVIRSLAPGMNDISFIPVGVLSLFLIGTFYFNYFVLIPRFLITKKYASYISGSVATILFAIGCSWLIFQALGVSPQNIENLNPIIRKIRPIAQSNSILTLIIVFVVSISMALNNRLKQTESEKLSAQLSSLKSQINPHFLFNVLNSIYVTAIDKAPVTAEMVLKLSEMMHYTMQDTQNDFVPLERELRYVHNYIDLQKVRLDSSIKLFFSVNGTVNEQQIAPMLMIPFIENAFKHGVNAEEDSDIHINIDINDEDLYLYTVNNKVKIQSETTESNGLGIENTRNRLQLLYPGRHQLKIDETAKTFSVSLHIQLT